MSPYNKECTDLNSPNTTGVHCDFVRKISNLNENSHKKNLTSFSGVDSLAMTIRNTTHITTDEKIDLNELCILNNIPWISAEQVIREDATDADTLTSVSWTMTASDQSVVDVARDWFMSSNLAKRRTYTHGSTTAKTIQKRRERSLKGYHPLCQTVKDSSLSYPYL